MSQFKFQKLQRPLLSTEHPHRLFELVATNICKQIEEPLYQQNLDRAAAAPGEAQTVYWLWLFSCEASSNGIADFVLQQLGIYSPQVHAALKAVGATELVRRLEAAIPLARPSADFTTLADQSWFDKFAPVPEFPTLQSVDVPVPESRAKDVYTLIESLDDLVVAFIRANESVLFKEE